MARRPNETRPIKVAVFLSPDEWLSACELAVLRGQISALGTRMPLGKFLRQILLREIAAAERNLDAGIPDVSPTRKHAREVPRARAHVPARKPFAIGLNTVRNASPRGPQ